MKINIVTIVLHYALKVSTWFLPKHTNILLFLKSLPDSWEKTRRPKLSKTTHLRNMTYRDHFAKSGVIHQGIGLQWILIYITSPYTIYSRHKTAENLMLLYKAKQDITSSKKGLSWLKFWPSCTKVLNLK